MERLSGERKVNIEVASKNKPNLLIDIQARIIEGKGEVYEQWAKIFNLEQLAKTLIFLQEKGIEDYDDLVSKSSDQKTKAAERSDA